jgi:hypothetical protein
LSGRAEFCSQQSGGVGSNARSARAAAHCAAGQLEPIHDTRLLGRLRFKQVPLTGVIVASWVIAFVEYWHDGACEPLGCDA